MTVLSKVRIGLAVGCCMVAAGCAEQEGLAPVAPPEPEIAISCIAVMPVQVIVDVDNAMSQADEKRLQDGRQVMDGLLKQQLADTVKARFIPEGQVQGKGQANAQQLAGRAKCNAVLETTLSRYQERVGNQYGVQDSAAVTFAYKLYEVSSGRVLCHGRFDEKQQPLMDNLLTLPKTKSRGLGWLSAEELLRDGMQERLGQCLYLEGK